MSILAPERSSPRQNRVDPFGNVIATPARGALMGNRGRLHDASCRIVRRYVGGYRAWVTCVLEFRGRRRRVMTPGRYTELFFLDEATALAAGHRPCGECRRADYLRFTTAWNVGNAGRKPDGESGIAGIDREMHRDRIDADGGQRTFAARIDVLPDGVFVTVPGHRVPLLLWEGALWPWSPTGYDAPQPPLSHMDVIVLTPQSTVRAIAAGYGPRLHESLERRGPGKHG